MEMGGVQLNPGGVLMKGNFPHRDVESSKTLTASGSWWELWHTIHRYHLGLYIYN